MLIFSIALFSSAFYEHMNTDTTFFPFLIVMSFTDECFIWKHQLSFDNASNIWFSSYGIHNVNLILAFYIFRTITFRECGCVISGVSCSRLILVSHFNQFGYDF